MKKSRLRLLSVFLILNLTLPSPSWALRQLPLPQTSTGAEELTTALQSGTEESRTSRWIMLAAAALLGLFTSQVHDQMSPTAPPLEKKQAVVQPASVPVIPGLKGFGVDTPAGRGGAILHVTSLADSGPGTLRWALEQKGPRTILFDRSGTIWLNSSIEVREPFFTIAGQSAPGPGITIAGAGIDIWTHDGLVQHLRIRVGDRKNNPELERDPLKVLGSMDPKAPKGWKGGAQRIVIANCSFSWWTDDFSIWYGASKFTYWRCLAAGGLNASIHPKGKHSKVFLIGHESKDVAILECLVANNVDRHPFFKDGSSGVVAGNVFYSPFFQSMPPPDNIKFATHIGSDDYPDRWWRGRHTFPNPVIASIVNNVYIGQPDAYAVGIWGRRVGKDPKDPLSQGADPGTKVHMRGNRAVNMQLYLNQADFDPLVSQPPVWVPGLVPLPSDQVEQSVLARAGAFPRDAIDARVVEQVRTRTGKIINSQDEVGGWLVIPENRARFRVPRNPHAVGPDGYTNLERELQERARRLESGEEGPQSMAPRFLEDLFERDRRVLFSGFTFTSNSGETGTVLDDGLGRQLVADGFLEPGRDRMVRVVEKQSAVLSAELFSNRRIITQFELSGALLPAGVTADQVVPISPESFGQARYDLQQANVQPGDVLLLKDDLTEIEIRDLLPSGVRPLIVLLSPEAQRRLKKADQIIAVVRAAQRRDGALRVFTFGEYQGTQLTATSA